MASKPRIKPIDGAYTTDSFRNFVSSVGRGTGNQHDGAQYGFNPVTRNRMQLDWVYRGSWVAGRVIDCVAKDMTREGVQVISSDAPAKIAELNRVITGLRVWDQLCDTIKWARLYGGAIAFLMIDGQEPASPLRIETIRPGQFKGLLPMDRWLVSPSSDLVTEFGPDYGKPTFYDTLTDAGGMPRLRIHYSRVVRIEGIVLPYWQRVSEMGWGLSVLERMWDRLVAFDSTTTGIAQLVYKAHLRTLKIENLREAIAAGAPAMSGIAAQVNQIRVLQSNEGLTVLDSKDEFEAHQYTFGGLDKILICFGEQLSGATEIPLVKLFGQSPSGFSSGDADLKNYNSGIGSAQEHDLATPVDIVYRIAYRSAFGTDVPKGFSLEFNPLGEVSDEENAKIVNLTTAAVNTAYTSQIISRATALKELKQVSHKTGVFSNVSEKEIAEAEDEPAPSPEMLGLVPPTADPADDP